jgi:uncharacterized protein YxjI
MVFRERREERRDLEVQGNIVDREYEFEAERRKVAEVSKKWFRVRDPHGVEIDPDRDVPLLLAVTVEVGPMAHPDR